MTRAFIIGNGTSRQGFDLHSLRPYGKIYGCNALYREFTPDVLVATDRPIANEIQNTGYALTHTFYTRRPLPDLGARTLPQPYWPYSSGPNAIGLACIDGAKQVYLLGFDVGSPNDKINNIYAGTEFYKDPDYKAIFNGQWIKQMQGIFKNHPNTQFTRVLGTNSISISEFNNAPNLSYCQISDFLSQLNNVKG